jgi:DNA-binding NarL/FixJ family response regulator
LRAALELPRAPRRSTTVGGEGVVTKQSETGPVYFADPSRRIRLVIADDSPDIRLLLQIEISDRAELELVSEATTGHEALRLATALRPDVLILDLKIPVLDGLTALPQVALVAPDTRVVIVSAFPADLYSAAALAAGAVAYVEKTTPIKHLVDDVMRGAGLLDTVLEPLPASASQTWSRQPRSASQARSFVAAALGTWEQPHLIETVQLLISELITNVLIHTTTTPAARITLLRDHVHVEVLDGDPTPANARAAAADETSGRGLNLVGALASAWGSTELAHGKVVWFDLAR